MVKKILGVVTPAIFTCFSYAGDHDSKLTPESLFSGQDLNGSVVQNIAFSPDGNSITYLKGKVGSPGVMDLWVTPANGDGDRKLLVDGSELIKISGPMTETERARKERQRIFTDGVTHYQWGSSGKRILIPYSSGIYIADSATGSLEQIIKKEEAGVSDGRLSPLENYVSYIESGTLYIKSINGGGSQAITPEGDDSVSYGVAEFVAQEEFARDTGYWWSPNEQRVAYTRADESDITVASWIDIDRNGEVIERSQRFPFAGTSNAVVDLFVKDLETSKAVKIDLGNNPDFYLARVNWSHNGEVLYVQKQSRDQKTLELIAFDPVTGKGDVLITERQEPWLHIDLDFTPLSDGSFLWVSERTGYRHLYLYDGSGNLIRQVTSGDWPLAGRDRDRGIVGVNEQSGLVYVLGFRETPTEQHLYAVNYKQGGELKRVTDGSGWWKVVMNNKATEYIGKYSSFDVPPNAAVYDVSGQRLQWLSQNKLDKKHPYYPYLSRLPKPEYGQLIAEDGQSLEYVLLKPANFDKTKQYPAIVKVYGGPGRQKVTKAWRALEERLYLDAGFIVFQLDNRGTLNRGLKFEAPIYRNVTGPEVEDQLVGLKYLQSLPYVDAKRVGVTGWSYGGVMTLSMMTHPDSTFAAGAAGAPVTDWSLYDTHYTERFMGMPEDNVEGYKNSSLVPKLDKLKGRLLYIHGMSDDNVLFDNAVVLIARLQELSMPFDLMLYPGQRHSVIGSAHKTHLWRTYLEFFKRNLGEPVGN